MTLLEGQLAGVFASAFSAIYTNATLYRSAGVSDGKGGGTAGFDVGTAVKAQLEAATEAMRSSDDYTETDMRILVLAQGVARPDTDCQILVDGQRWLIAHVGRDPAGAYWDLHGRRA